MRSLGPQKDAAAKGLNTGPKNNCVRVFKWNARARFEVSPARTKLSNPCALNLIASKAKTHDPDSTLILVEYCTSAMSARSRADRNKWRVSCARCKLCGNPSFIKKREIYRHERENFPGKGFILTRKTMRIWKVTGPKAVSAHQCKSNQRLNKSSFHQNTPQEIT